MTAVVSLTACKKEGCTDENALNYNSSAKKDDGSCTYEDLPLYSVPSTYNFTDSEGHNTVDYSGQTTRINQLLEMVSYMNTAVDNTISAQQLKDMFANTNGDGNGAFSFSSTKQLKVKCFELDQALFESFMDSIALASASNVMVATSGQAGILLNAESEKHLFSANGIEYAQVIQKGLMGAVFMNQALNSYFSEAKMSVDNTTAVDVANGLYYTALEHHWDEAFGYFGVDPNFPTIPAEHFWGEYCNEHDATLGSNKVMMDNFLKGRAAISHKVLEDRDLAIVEIKKMWEKIVAYAAMGEISEAISAYNSGDVSSFLHLTSEAYGFVLSLRYLPLDTRLISTSEVNAILAKFGDNFWNINIAILNDIKADLDAKY